MTDRFVIVRREPRVEPKPFYFDQAEAVAALLQIRDAAKPEDRAKFVLVRVTEDPDGQMSTADLAVSEVETDERQP